MVSCQAMEAVLGPREGASESEVAASRLDASSSPVEVVVAPAEREWRVVPLPLRPSADELARSPGLAKGVDLLERGRTTEAAMAFESARRREAVGDRCAALHAWTLRDAATADAAERVAREAIARYGATPPLAYALATALERQGRDVEALALLRDVLRVWPDDPVLVREAAGAALSAGDPEAALALLDPLVARGPLGPESLRLRARALVEAGRPEEGWILLERLARTAPPDPALTEDLALAAAAVAERSGLEDHHRRAVELLREVVAWDPQHQRAWFLLGRSLAALGQAGEAEAALRRALELDPADAEAALLLAEVLVEAGRRDEACRCLDEALRRPLAPDELERVQLRRLELEAEAVE